MERYIIELKESPARKLLRYALWVIILLGLVALVGSALKMLVDGFVEGQNKAAAGLLAEFSPPQAIAMAEKIYRMEPNDKTRLALIKMTEEAGDWALADALLDSQRPSAGFLAICADARALAHVCPAELPAVLQKLKILPQNDEDRLLLVKTAAEVSDPALSALAKNAARHLESDFFHDRVTLYLAQIALGQNDLARAKELSLGLLTRSFAPTESTRLLSIYETLKLPEADDYRSTLKLASRESVPMALALARHMAGSTEPDKIAAWISSLPKEICDHPELKLKSAELLYIAGNTDGAVATLSQFGDANLETALTSLLRGLPIAYKNLTAAELTTLARFLEALNFPAQELPILTELNSRSPTLWSLQAAISAAEAAHDEAAIITAYQAMDAATDHAGIVRANLAYWTLVTSNDTTKAKTAYEILKSVLVIHPDRPLLQSALALAHYRLGNLTDALLALPASPTTPRENLISAFLLAKAGQYEKAGTLLKEVPADKLSPHEAEMANTTTKLLQSNAPLQRALELLKQN